MPTRATAWKTLRTLTAVAAAEADPTTSSTWVNIQDIGGGHFTKARVSFSPITKAAADNTATFQVWGRQGANLFILNSVDVAADALTTTYLDALDLGVTGEVSFFLQVSLTAGTSETFTGTAYIQGYNDDAG